MIVIIYMSILYHSYWNRHRPTISLCGLWTPPSFKVVLCCSIQ